MSNLSQFFGGGGIKSIQRGVMNGASIILGDLEPTTATISPVDTTKSILYFLGFSHGAGLAVADIAQLIDDGVYTYSSRIELTNSTTITATPGPRFGSILAIPIISWQLVEYY